MPPCQSGLFVVANQLYSKALDKPPGEGLTIALGQKTKRTAAVETLLAYAS